VKEERKRLRNKSEYNYRWQQNGREDKAKEKEELWMKGGLWMKRGLWVK
jgi:hypothetical protein